MLDITAPHLVDSNILLRISRRNDPNYAITEAALERLLEAGSALYYTHQNIAEFWNVWTRPADKNGFGLAADRADREIAKFETMMDFAADCQEVYDLWRKLVREYDVKGVQVHDVRLVAAMLTHGIPNLLTLNTTHFDRYASRITPVHPSTLVRPF